MEKLRRWKLPVDVNLEKCLKQLKKARTMQAEARALKLLQEPMKYRWEEVSHEPSDS